jgi:uncharacterized SAM-binding protein YcdF (DUF218 family)
MLLIAMIALFVTIFFILYFFWIHTAPIKPCEADVLVILGYRCDGDAIHPLLKERLETALYLLRQYPVGKIIVTGGAVSSRKTEAEIMTDYLVRHGVDRHRIVLDTVAKDTIENLLNCRKVMQKDGLRNCIIVSNSFHIRRIQCIAKSFGLNAGFYANRKWTVILKQVIRTLNELRAFAVTLWTLKVEKRFH